MAMGILTAKEGENAWVKKLAKQTAKAMVAGVATANDYSKHVLWKTTHLHRSWIMNEDSPRISSELIFAE